MTDGDSTSYPNDPLFHQAFTAFQNGEWEKGLADLDELLKSYPLDHELRTLRQEMQLRSKIDVDEEEDKQIERKRNYLKLALQLMVVAVIAGLIYWGVDSYSSWLQQQWQNTRSRVETEVQNLELTIKFRDAQDLINGGRAEEAQPLIEEIYAADPNYPGLDTITGQAENLITLDMQYEKASQLMEQGDLEGALEIFYYLEDDEPLFKDVSILIADIESQMYIDNLWSNAEEAYESEQWITAASAYETLHALDPLFKSDIIEQRLFNSYLDAAKTVLVEQKNSLEALEIAEDYFGKALALRPQDAQVKKAQAKARATVEERLINSYITAARGALTREGDSLEALRIAQNYFNKALAIRPDDPNLLLEREMAQRYLNSQDNFNKNLWSEVITDLEYIYKEDHDYALGTSRITLYEALMARGDEKLAAAMYEAALSDFQRAAVLADETPDATIRLYEVQIKVAEVKGVLGEYEKAALTYQAAIELVGLREAASEKSAGLAGKLDQAEHYIDIRYYKSSYRLYREVASELIPLYETITHQVQSGEYITQLANRYKTTVNAILDANENLSPKMLVVGEELIIPTTP